MYHMNHPKQKTSYKCLHLLWQIKYFYDQQDLILHSDRGTITISLTTYNTKTTITVYTFYKFAKPLVTQSLEQAKELGKSFCKITIYFCPIDLPYPTNTTPLAKANPL